MGAENLSVWLRDKVGVGSVDHRLGKAPKTPAELWEEGYAACESDCLDHAVKPSPNPYLSGGS